MVTNSVGKETHRPPSYTQPTGFHQGSQLKRGKHNHGLCFPPALQLAHLAQPEGHQLSPARHSLWGHQNPSAVAREGLGRKEESRQRLNCKLHHRKCFSSQITWRCSQISAYIGFSIYLFLFPKHSRLLYDEKKDWTARMLSAI